MASHYLKENNHLIKSDSQILVTGAGGFIGKRVVASLLEYGFTNIRCLVRPSANPKGIYTLLGISPDDSRIEIYQGNLLSNRDCYNITNDAQVIYHLAAGRGLKSFPDAYLNSVITTRNLLDGILKHKCLKRLVNISSFAVYSNRNKPIRSTLDENCPIEKNPALRGSPYCYAKIRQEKIVFEYSAKHDLPYVTLRPGVVYGPGNEQIHGRVGLGTFGIFLHLGGSNQIPLSYVENCADAIILSGILKKVDAGEVFNVVDDNLPTSLRFLQLYKDNVKRFPSIYVPQFLSFFLCYLWEVYSKWSKGQLPNAFNRKVWHATWRKTFYSNEKIKRHLGWSQKIETNEGLNAYFKSCREKIRHD